MLFVFLFTGAMCPFRHISGEKTVVCKHWLRGLCKKGDQCEFLHEYDMTKMPECYFYSKFGSVICRFPFKCDRICSAKILLMCRVCAAGECSNKECPFLHIDPESKIKDCPWYDRGFCKHGKYCYVMPLVDFTSNCIQSWDVLYIPCFQALTADTDIQEGWFVSTIW